ncbi:mitochondrial carrier [Russula aff. rugulosa BPL654]|nr:mitochondrial carrier [Russula aff. rugulosa BPL654]
MASSISPPPDSLPIVHADSGDSDGNAAARVVQSVKSAVRVPESEIKRWRRTFDSNAKSLVEGERFLDREQFVNAIAPKGDLTRIGRSQFATLFRVADVAKRGLLSWDDFVVFQTLLKRPDADYYIAFQYFDVDGSGTITFDEFKSVFSAEIGPDAIPFNFDCDWVKLHLGKKKDAHVLGYNEFTQLMKGLQGERLRQAFRYFDENQEGVIRPAQFKRIMLELAGHKLSDAVIELLPTVSALSPGGRISFSEVVACHNVIREMDIIERLLREATAKSKDGRIDQTGFLNYAASSSRYSLFTPMEVSIVFHFAGRGAAGQRLAFIDFAQLLDPRWRAPGDLERATAEAAAKTTASTFLSNLAESAYNFLYGRFAGAFGATIVYPIDLGMSLCQMQNQRSTIVGQLLYKNSLDCVRKVLRNEGLLGFYRGLGPQLIGVAPEKAIKLTVNDLVRGRATDPETGRISPVWEIVAGGTAGGCQVVFTNPLEIVKIRLQVQGEAAKVEGAVPRGAIHIVRQLGLLGLYRGASACLLRDIPFSAIYFPTYAHLKKDLFHEGYHGKRLSFLETLTSAAIAGMPAAYLTTPADVVKTRLQVEARKGQTNYKGLTDAFVRIYREEGFKALFKGGPARIIRSSPQFGFTLVAYEYLHKRQCVRRLMGVVVSQYPWKEAPREVETALTSRGEEIAKTRARNAMKILLDVHGDFGRRSPSGGL